MPPNTLTGKLLEQWAREDAADDWSPEDDEPERSAEDEKEVQEWIAENNAKRIAKLEQQLREAHEERHSDLGDRDLIWLISSGTFIIMLAVAC